MVFPWENQFFTHPPRIHQEPIEDEYLLSRRPGKVFSVSGGSRWL